MIPVKVIKGADMHPSTFIVNVSRTFRPLRWSMPPVSMQSFDFFPVLKLSSKYHPYTLIAAPRNKKIVVSSVLVIKLGST